MDVINAATKPTILIVAHSSALGRHSPMALSLYNGLATLAARSEQSKEAADGALVIVPDADIAARKQRFLQSLAMSAQRHWIRGVLESVALAGAHATARGPGHRGSTTRDDPLADGPDEAPGGGPTDGPDEAPGDPPADVPAGPGDGSLAGLLGRSATVAGPPGGVDARVRADPPDPEEGSAPGFAPEPVGEALSQLPAIPAGPPADLPTRTLRPRAPPPSPLASGRIAATQARRRGRNTPTGPPPGWLPSGSAPNSSLSMPLSSPGLRRSLRRLGSRS